MGKPYARNLDLKLVDGTGSIDAGQYNTVTFVVMGAGTAPTMTIQESDDGTTFTDVDPVKHLVWYDKSSGAPMLPATLETGTSANVGYVGNKRYVKGTGTGVYVILGDPRRTPA